MKLPGKVAYELRPKTQSRLPPAAARRAAQSRLHEVPRERRAVGTSGQAWPAPPGAARHLSCSITCLRHTLAKTARETPSMWSGGTE